MQRVPERVFRSRSFGLINPVASNGGRSAVRKMVWQGAPSAWFEGTLEYPEAQTAELQKKFILDAAAGRMGDIAADILAGANPNMVPDEGEWMSPLHRAALCNQVDAAGLLLHSGANPNLGVFYRPGVDEPAVTSGFTPLMAAASAGSLDVARLLVSQGALVNVHSGRSHPRPGFPAVHSKTTALIQAVGSPNVVAFLLGAGARPNEIEANGDTALFWAAWDGDTATAAILLRAGADACLRDDQGRTATQVAAENLHYDTQRLIARFAMSCPTR